MAAEDLTGWTEVVRDDCSSTLALLAQRSAVWPAPLNDLAAQVVQAGAALSARIARVARARPQGVKTRVHGDLHLAQVLICRDDYFVIDFEGEPQRSFEQRRAKQSPLRDVAGMLRSFDYARHTALHHSAQGVAELERLGPVARLWERQVREAFLATYFEVAQAGGLYGQDEDRATNEALLDLFELEKALYELRYEIDHRPDWVAVPLAGIAALAGILD